MWRPAGMFVLSALVATGCSRTQIVRMTSLEQASVAKLADEGSPQKEGDEALFVLDEPLRVEDVTAFFRARADYWRPTGDLPRPARYTLSFCKGGEVTDVFWLDQGRIETKDKSGATYCITLSDDDVDELVGYFHWLRNFKSRT